MRNINRLLGIAAATALLGGQAFAGSVSAPVSAPAPAPESAFSGSLHIGYNSDYIFRGVDLGNGMAEAGLNGSYDLGNGFAISGGLWYASIEDSAYGNGTLFGPGLVLPDHYSELDLYAQVSKDFGFLTANIGYIWYHYENTDIRVPGGSFKLIDDAQEIYFGVSRELGWGINGALTYYWDVEGDNGGYTEIALSKNFAIQDRVSLDAGVKAGYLFEEGGFSHITPQLVLNYKATDTVTISPYIAYSVELDHLEDVSANKLGLGGSQHNYLYGGVKLSVSF